MFNVIAPVAVPLAVSALTGGPLVTKSISKLPDPFPLSTLKLSLKLAVASASPLAPTPDGALREATSRKPKFADAVPLPDPLKFDRTVIAVHVLRYGKQFGWSLVNPLGSLT